MVLDLRVRRGVGSVTAFCAVLLCTVIMRHSRARPELMKLAFVFLMPFL